MKKDVFKDRKRFVCMLLSFILLMLPLVHDAWFFKLDDKERNEIFMNTKENKLKIGLWVTPRLHAVQTQEETDARFAEIAEAGINTIYTHNEASVDLEWLDREIIAAEKYDISVIVHLPYNTTEEGIENMISVVKRTTGKKAVIGYCVIDEPGYTSFDVIADISKRIREAASKDQFVMCNMLPNYAPTSAYAAEPDKGMTHYQTYLDSYMKKTNSEIISFDFYPFRASSDTDTALIGSMMSNLSDIRNAAVKYGAESWGFVQDSSWAGTRIPDDTELCFLTHIHLMFGLRSFSYFLYWQPSDTPGSEGVFQGMVTYAGERTDIYYRVQKQNEALKAMKGVYLDYDHEGFIWDNMCQTYIDGIAENLRLESFSKVISVNSKYACLASCFRNHNDPDKVGLYVLNLSTARPQSIIIDLLGIQDYKVWSAKGLEIAGRGSSVSVELNRYDAAFIEIG